MFNKIFGKDDPAPTPAELAAAAEEAARAERQAWDDKLKAAAGDDEALLALAIAAPAVDLKCAAVNAIAGEETLRRAEREFRDHDRRVHRDAKKRYEGTVARREARASADELIRQAGDLLQEASVPANRLVDLDKAWQALATTDLEAGQVTQFSERWQQLTAVTRERGDQQQRTKRWLAESAQAASRLVALCQEVAQDHKERSLLAPACAQIDAALAAAPPETPDAKSNRIGEMRTTLLEARDLATALEARHAWLAALATAGEPMVDSTARAAEWQALPAVQHAAIARILDAGFARWQHTDSAERNSRNQQELQQKRELSQAAQREKIDAMTQQVVEAETALAAGHLNDVAPLLTTIDNALKGFSPDKKLTARIEVVQAEYARLRGWQHWGGGRVREDVVAEAEALATAITAPKLALRAHADAIDKLRERWKELDKLGGATNKQLWQRFDTALKTAYTPVAEQLAKQKAARQENLEARRKLIEALDAIPLHGETAPKRKPPKAAPAKKAPADLTSVDTAAIPVVVTEPVPGMEAAPEIAVESAPHVLAEPAPHLPAEPVLNMPVEQPTGDAPQAGAETALPAVAVSAAVGSDVGTQAADWRAIARSLDHFQTEWRKLGPVQHTVPRKAQDGLAKQLAASVARLETPLNEARHVEKLKREKLIERAAALSADARGRDTINKVRELQAEWQQQAKGLPLARNVENALWVQFKAATDAVFKARDAAHAARDNELKSNETGRVALIDRLAALNTETTAAEIKRTIADVDNLWRKSGEAPRNVAAKLDARFRSARDAAQQLLAGSAQRAWGVTCDALTSKLALCAAAEAAAGEIHQEAWAALPTLPPAWEAAMSKRFSAAQAGKNASADDAALREQLLQLESALDIPSPPAMAEDRRMLKLRAMKLALEGRQPSGPAGPEALLAAVLAAPRPSADAAARISKVVAALRSKPPR